MFFVKDPDGLCYCLGQPRRIIKVFPHNPAWAESYRQEARKLKSIFGQELLSIHHIGSTAIPVILAKPVIDILIEVKNLDLIGDFDNAMIGLRYDPRGDDGAGRLYYSKNTEGIRTHQVHICQTGNAEIEDLVNFRDYLIAYPEEAKAYGQLKEQLTRRFPEDIASYIEGKGTFIKNIYQKARPWRKM